MDSLLPAVAYQAPPRLARGRTLNTIIEDHEVSFHGRSSESGTDDDSTLKGTVIGRPDGLERELFVSRRQSLPNKSTIASSPVSDASSSSSNGARINRGPNGFDDLYDASDDETEFSESCPSLRDSTSSRPTSFATDSTRSSVSISRSKNRYPAIMIPRTSWNSIVSPLKDSPVPPTPPPKIPVSPAILSLLPRFVPAINAPPSLDGSASSVSDRLSNISAPVTPDVHDIVEGQTWGGHDPVRLRREPDSAREDAENESMPSDGDVLIERPEDWDLIRNFPRIPGATPEDVSPLAPAIPNFTDGGETTPSDRAFQLPSDALRTLDHLTRWGSSDQKSEVSTPGQPEDEMKEVSATSSRPRSFDGVTPYSENSGYSFSQLSIPSPGGFFSSLRSGTRHTWCPGQGKMSNPPSSTTAENFYNVPWLASERIVERVVEVPDMMTEGSSTARQACFDNPTTAPNTARRVSTCESSSDRSSHVSERPRSQEICYEYEEAYESELQQTAAANLDRTSTWLAAQTSYLSALREHNPANDLEGTSIINQKRLSAHGKNNSLDSPMKKAVRFLEETARSKEDLVGAGDDRKEAIYLEAFQHLTHTRRQRDAFVLATPRFDTVQAFRFALMDLHVDQLLGKYEMREPTRPAYSGPFSQNPRQTGVFDLTPAQMVFIKVEREKEALDQIASSAWVIEALKYLNRGRLLTSPAATRLANARLPLDDPKCIGRNRFRILDLGGTTSCDWAWHCAQKWPNVKTYTVVTKSQTTNPSLSRPANHRQVSVPHLWQLPFRDGHFDVISARSLHALLKHEPVPGEKQIDEYDLCLKECMRVLKKDGYFEFLVMDAAISHSGPLGSTMSVEFSFNLKTRGYDPLPTRAFLSRLRKANFVDIKRAWMFLPMGAPTRDKAIVRETPTPHVPSLHEASMEAVQGPVGSTADVANISGILGSWMWEQWMLKLQLEMGRERGKLLEGVGAVIEEGRNTGAGWNCLSGWARKPRGTGKSHRGTIEIRIDAV